MKSAGSLPGMKRGLARHGLDVLVLADAHVEEPAHGGLERLVVDAAAEGEVRAATDALDGQAVGAAAGEGGEVAGVHIGAGQVPAAEVAAALLPERHRAHLLLGAAATLHSVTFLPT